MTSRFRVALTGLVCFGSALPATLGQTVPPDSNGRSAAVAANSRAGSAGRLNMENLAVTMGPKAIARVEGNASPGLKLTLDGSASSGGRVWYRWIQTRGTKVNLQGADAATATFIVPPDEPTMTFVLVVGNGAGVDARAVEVAIRDPEDGDSDLPLKAEAGDDQVATVGQRVTLDGNRSEPRGHVKFRWVQTSGPKVTDLACNGPDCSFVPASAGSYQFALLVLGAHDLVSEAALVTVRAKNGKAAKSDASATAAEAPPMAIDDLARTSILAIPGGMKYAPALATAFDSVADRMDLFKTYFDAASEMTRRLDAVVPREPSLRAEWMDHFFKPWTARVVELMRDDRLDLTLPAGQTKPLSKAQRARLAEQFRFTAAGLRAGSSLR